MKFAKNRIAAITIAIFFMFSMSASMILIPSASAVTLASGKIDIQLFAFCNVAPNPIGVGQSVNVGFWLNEPCPDAGTIFGDRWTNMTVKVTLPDGTTTTLGPFTADDTGGTHTEYTPTGVGTYTFQMSFTGQILAGNNPPPTGFTAIQKEFIGDYYLPATSNIATLTVQTQSVGGVTPAPLPTSWWQTPVTAMNVNNWNAITGASLSAGSYNYSSNYNPYTTAPTTSHILWTKPEAFGGTLGGPFPASTTYGNYYSTSQYEKKFSPVIINGFLYYNIIAGSSTTPCGLVCLSLYTGQIVWDDNSANYGGGSPAYSALTSAGLCTTLWRGQVLDYVSPNQFGGLAYIWTTGTPAWITSDGYATTGTTLNMFDAETGTYILSVVNGTAPTVVPDQSGDLIGYYINYTVGAQTLYSISSAGNVVKTQVSNNGNMLDEWNSTQAIITYDLKTGYQTNLWEWRPPQSQIVPFSYGLMWSMPLATSISGNAIPSYTTAPGGIRCIDSGVIVCTAFAPAGGSYFQAGYGIYSGYSQTTGQLLWVENITMTPFAEDGNTGATTAVGVGVWTIPSHQTGIIQGYSLATGKVLWTTSLTPFDPYDSIGGYMTVQVNGTLYLAGFGGDIWSINMLTGRINWYTNTTILQGSSGTNSPYGVWPIWGFSGGAVADGVLFLQEGHEYSPPLFLGAQQLAINCTTGKLVWDIDAFDVDGSPVIAYGIMPILNAYDNQIYAYSMGPSKTTVTAPDVGVTTSTPVTITGTVMDISAGSQQNAVAANFPNGLPCVSDASMTQWMEYVYMQQPLPTNVTGVPVTIAVTDKNGNCYNIGTTTTNPTTGFFSLNWTPIIPGNYTVTATFAGTQSYYGSYANAAFYASSPAPTAAPTASPVTGLASTGTVMLGVAAIIIVIIICVAVLAVLMLRKRP